MSQVFKPSWATADPSTMGVSTDIHAVSNLVAGKWADASSRMTIPDPMDRDAQPIFTIPDTQVEELGPFFESLRKVPKSGVHNPLKNPDRYVKYGEISRKVCFTTVALNFVWERLPLTRLYSIRPEMHFLPQKSLITLLGVSLSAFRSHMLKQWVKSRSLLTF